MSDATQRDTQLENNSTRVDSRLSHVITRDGSVRTSATKKMDGLHCTGLHSAALFRVGGLGSNRIESHRIATDPRPRQCRPVESSCSCTAHAMLTRVRTAQVYCTVLYCVGAPAPRAPASTTRVAARQSSATQLRVGQCCPIGTARHSAAQRDANGSTGREGQMGTGTGGGEGRGRRERERRAVLSGVSSGQRKHLCCS